MLDHLDVGVQGLDREPRGLRLRHPDPVGVVDHLALQVGCIDDVVIDEADRPDPGGGEVEAGRGAEAARAEQQDLGVEQLELALEADLGNEQMARVALLLVLGQRPGRDHRQAAIAPQGDPPANEATSS